MVEEGSQDQTRQVVRPRGRPREASAKRSSIYVRVPERVHDDVIARANAANITPTEWMRRAVFSVLYKSRKGNETAQ